MNHKTPTAAATPRPPTVAQAHTLWIFAKITTLPKARMVIAAAQWASTMLHSITNTVRIGRTGLMRSEYIPT